MLHVSVKSLNRALKIAKYENTTRLPILDYVVIEPGGVTMTNLETAQRHAIDAQGTGRYFVPAENAKKLMQALSADPSIDAILLSFDDGNYGEVGARMRRVDAWGSTVIRPTVGTFEARYGVPRLDQFPDISWHDPALSYDYTVDAAILEACEIPAVSAILKRTKTTGAVEIALTQQTVIVTTDTLSIAQKVEADDFARIQDWLRPYKKQVNVMEHQEEREDSTIITDVEGLTPLSDECRNIVRWFGHHSADRFCDPVAPIQVERQRDTLHITQDYDGLADPEVIFYDTGQAVFALSYYVEVDDRTVTAPDVLFVEQWLETMFDAAQVMPRQSPPFYQLAA